MTYINQQPLILWILVKESGKMNKKRVGLFFCVLQLSHMATTDLFLYIYISIAEKTACVEEKLCDAVER